jgi:hypothetical protein
VFITLSCIKLGNIPEKSLTQARARPCAAHDQQRQLTIDQLEETADSAIRQPPRSGLVQQEVDNLNDALRNVLKTGAMGIIGE